MAQLQEIGPMAILWFTVVSLFVTGLVTFGFKMYKIRSSVRKLQKQGLPMPPHHFLFGHIHIIAKLVSSLPPEAYGQYIANQIRLQYPHLDTAFYLDTWPFGPTILGIISPDMICQFMQDRLLPKHAGLRYFLKPLTGDYDLVTMEGPMWKKWRAIFNPGFSASHIMTLIPGMVDETQVFRDILQSAAEKAEIFQLEHATLNLAVDIIGEVVMDYKLRSQVQYNDMMAALQSQLKWSSIGIEINLLEYLNFARPFVHWYNSRRMNRYISRVLDERYDNIQDKARSKSIIDLALNAYHAQNTSQENGTMDNYFKELAMAQIKLFIFAGHDTTSISAVYTYHLLAKHPDALARIRAEHDSVLGSDSSQAGSLLSANPQLINQLPYTLACIKEAMRLYPPVAGLRQGQSGYFLTGADGTKFPTENCLVWGSHYGLHHNPHYWPRAEDFLPERWLVPKDDPLYPYKNAWRPFERGPRNCIGQEVALVEIKVMLALTIRDFDIVDAYGEWDARHHKAKGRTLNGDRAYMIYRGSGHPSDFYPCRITARKHVGKAR